MRTLIALLLLTGAYAYAQAGPDDLPNGQPQLKNRTEVPAEQVPADKTKKDLLIVPAGTKVPVQLRQAVSTKNARPGDPIYGQTTFPVVLNEQILIPAGTYAQGVVDSVKRAGRIKGTAEMQFHITTLIFPNGYTVNMAAAIDQVPGDESSQVKEPGTVKHDSEKGRDLARIGTAATQAGAIGGMAGAAATGTGRGFGIGGLAGIGAGTMIGLLARGSDVRFEVGTVVEVALNHAIALDPVKAQRASTMPASYHNEPYILLPPRGNQ
jgi:type IV secretion system protein VirB10